MKGDFHAQGEIWTAAVGGESVIGNDVALGEACRGCQETTDPEESYLCPCHGPAAVGACRHCWGDVTLDSGRGDGKGELRDSGVVEVGGEAEADCGDLDGLLPRELNPLSPATFCPWSEVAPADVLDTVELAGEEAGGAGIHYVASACGSVAAEEVPVHPPPGTALFWHLEEWWAGAGDGETMTKRGFSRLLMK